MTAVGSTEISVENFKSLRSFQISLDNFNVLIGINGSGKTNILELFKFANMCIDSPRIPAYPFRAWSGFKNIVWSHDIGAYRSVSVLNMVRASMTSNT